MTRVENDAPMGRLLRENYWFPAALSHILVRDGKPHPVRLLGENFVVFRSTDGRVGFFNEHCPHRRASLLLARNEDNALRCIFHGWKFGVDGEVLEVPTEPNNQTEYCKNVPLKHYPVREAGGMVWVWLGAGEAKRFPDFRFNTVPDDQVYAVCQKVEANWVQDVEQGLDSAHVGILHSHWLKAFGIAATGVDTAPTYELENTPAGYRYAAIRKMADGQRYFRVSEFVMPFFAFIPPEEMPDGDALVIITTPVDDYNSTHWMLRYNRLRPLKYSFMNPVEDRTNFPPLPPGGHDESWGQDRDAMLRGHFTGFHHINTEDFAVANSLGTIVDRTQEYLNTADRPIMRLRQQLLDTVKQFVAGETMKLVNHETVAYAKVQADAYVQPAETQRREAS